MLNERFYYGNCNCLFQKFLSSEISLRSVIHIFIITIKTVFYEYCKQNDFRDINIVLRKRGRPKKGCGWRRKMIWK